MVGKRRVTFYGRQSPGASAFVRNRIGIADSEREVRIVIEEEGGDVIVEDQKQDVRFLFRQPAADRLIGFGDRSPNRVVRLLAVQSESNSRGMRRSNRSDDF